jgi:hypothetical protein
MDTKAILGRDGRINVKLALCLANKVLIHDDVWGNGWRDPRFVNFGDSWR